jgi:hypothetical protein
MGLTVARRGPNYRCRRARGATTMTAPPAFSDDAHDDRPRTRRLALLHARAPSARGRALRYRPHDERRANRRGRGRRARRAGAHGARDRWLERRRRERRRSARRDCELRAPPRAGRAGVGHSVCEPGRCGAAVPADGCRVSRALGVARAVALHRGASAGSRADRRRRRLRPRRGARRARRGRRRPHTGAPLRRRRGALHASLAAGVRGERRDRAAPRALAAASRGATRGSVRPRVRHALVHRRDRFDRQNPARRARGRAAPRGALPRRHARQPRARELTRARRPHRVHGACAPHRRCAKSPSSASRVAR